MGLKKILENKQGPVPLSIKMDFLKELTNRKNIYIDSQAKKISTKIMQVTQVMRTEKGEEACKAIFVIDFIDMKIRKLIDPTPKWLQAIRMED